MEVKTLKLEMHSNSCEDYILYYDVEKRLGFEVQFDNGEFNGIVSCCEHIGEDYEEWELTKSRHIYRTIRNKAINDYSKLN